MRNLASIQKIVSVKDIPGADNICAYQVLGWWVVGKKNEFKPGELCVYIEIDSLLPDETVFEFMKPRGMRVRTIKLRGQVSQGIVFKPNDLPKCPMLIKEGLDVTEALGIVKYEPNADNAEEKDTRTKWQRAIDKITWKLGLRKGKGPKGHFPIDIPKTDETRVQNLGRLLHTVHGVTMYATEKLDGSSMTVFYKPDQEVFGGCSRNRAVYVKYTKEPSFWQKILRQVPKATVDTSGSKYTEMALKLGLDKSMPRLASHLAIQGELIGPGIQKNRYNLKEHKFYVFSVYDIKAKMYVDLNTLKFICKELNLEHVPMVAVFEFNKDEHTIDFLVETAKGKSVLHASTHREGIVIRPIGDQCMPGWTPCSFKAINPDFLLKYDE